jgi:hypothetical protein
MIIKRVAECDGCRSLLRTETTSRQFYARQKTSDSPKQVRARTIRLQKFAGTVTEGQLR